jgi:UPF0716 family protein affecting phage T7 exclusion
MIIAYIAIGIAFVAIGGIGLARAVRAGDAAPKKGMKSRGSSILLIVAGLLFVLAGAIDGLEDIA